MNRKVVVDIDGVLADFEGSFCEEFGYERRELASLESRYPEHAQKITEFINDGFVYKNLKPLQLGLEIINWLNNEYFGVHIVTGRPFGLEGVTRRWLHEHEIYFDTFTLDVHKTGAISLLKPLCAVDDLFSVHTTLLRLKVPTILVAHPWNAYSGENIRRISNLHQFTKSFEEIIQERKQKL